MTDVTIISGQDAFAGYSRTNDGVYAGIVVLQETFGLNDFIRETVDRLADQGFNVVAPDLFWRQERNVRLEPELEADRIRATALMKGLDPADALHDIAAAASWLRGTMAEGAPIALLGFCLGGKLAVLGGLAGLNVQAVISYYGVGIQDLLGRLVNMRVPTLLHVAEADHLCPPGAQAAIREAAAGIDLVKVLAHPDAGHGFDRRGTSAYHREASLRATAATHGFLSEHMTI